MDDDALRMSYGGDGHGNTDEDKEGAELNVGIRRRSDGSEDGISDGGSLRG